MVAPQIFVVSAQNAPVPVHRLALPLGIKPMRSLVIGGLHFWSAAGKRWSLPYVIQAVWLCSSSITRNCKSVSVSELLNDRSKPAAVFGSRFILVLLDRDPRAEARKD
jgi:hypothetical protein